jgi:2-dehydropantoate 2-reductase
VAAIAETFSGAKFDSQLSTAILQEMWEKWAFIAAAAGICCLMRGAFGDIAAAGGSKYASDMFAECRAIAANNGFNPGDTAVKRGLGMFTHLRTYEARRQPEKAGAPGTPLVSRFRSS